jgi:CRISPR-associated protein Cmr5
MRTYDQKMAEKAFEKVNNRYLGYGNKEGGERYKSFASSFPSLVHSCGLVQAVAFAEAKGENDYLADLREVLGVVEKASAQNLPEASRRADVLDYMRLSRRALSASSWLKRYVQAIFHD